ncbi:hypothetical protein HER17_05280 [Pectobacterium carotovorum]|uniref:hypothetical protein n=1 Tax=Pectobacterium TaxID=122277 RepID=UPI0001A44870|nr:MULTISPECIES: hypothetical protein [Pectobacterium]MBQ4781286.1 hypothetical protein [Pectobacterium versatile]MBQ4785842.1 hypothetical protein [Pectobacterium versatile]MBQ4791711.1 hypothetical protein [Pectobacterium versatile]MCL6366043.1 hypothetical protein [Pectobacterium carotovorum subsp. carotovorum]QLL92395.1 hypothetical protein HER17_05280 [Pectobacterium carotovorum]
MSKFKELCNSFTSFRAVYSQSRDNSICFSKKLVLNYKEYLEISEKDYKLIPLEDEVKQNAEYTPFGASHLGDDGYWHMGFALTVYKDINLYPKQEFLIHFKFIRYEDGKYSLGVDGLKKESVITDINNKNEFNIIFEEIQNSILEYHETGINFLYGKNSKMPSIGFVQGNMANTLNEDK